MNGLFARHTAGGFEARSLPPDDYLALALPDGRNRVTRLVAQNCRESPLPSLERRPFFAGSTRASSSSSGEPRAPQNQRLCVTADSEAGLCDSEGWRGSEIRSGRARS